MGKRVLPFQQKEGTRSQEKEDKTMRLTRRNFIKIACAFIGIGALDAKEAAAGFISMPSQKHPKIMFYVV